MRAIFPAGPVTGAALIALGCSSASGQPPLGMEATPAHASMFGQVDVSLAGNFAALGDIQAVSVAGIAALDVRATPGTLTIRLQGAPAMGPATIVVHGSKGSGTNASAFAYDSPVGGAPPTWAAFGASLTQGFQSDGVDAHGQTMSWDAQIARSAGVFLALPLVADGLLPPTPPSAFVGNCGATSDLNTIASAVLMTLADPDTHQIDLRRARQDPTLATRNFAVGGALVSDMLFPASGQPRLIERIVEIPDGDPHVLAQAEDLSQVDRLVKLDPDVGVSADVLANDSDPAVTASDDLHPEQMTAVATIQSELTTMASRLGALHGDYFIGNLLPIDGLPNVAYVRAQRIAAGQDTPASFDAKLAQVRTLIGQYNDALDAAVAGHPNLHVVDLHTPTQAALMTTLTIGNATVNGKKFGGLLSLDHTHFTDTGYALIANIFIDAINVTKGSHIPQIDLAAVVLADPLSPMALHADGVFCDGTL